MKQNFILFIIFFVILFILNSFFVIRPFYQEIGGCAASSTIFPCLISGKLFLMFLGFTFFDFVLYALVFFAINLITFILTRSRTVNKFYKHIFTFLFIKLVLFSILFLRHNLPINYIYLFCASFLFMSIVETKLAYNELMIGNARARFFATLMPSGIIGLIKVGIFYVIYPMGMVVVNWQIYWRLGY